MSMRSAIRFMGISIVTIVIGVLVFGFFFFYQQAAGVREVTKRLNSISRDSVRKTYTNGVAYTVLDLDGLPIGDHDLQLLSLHPNIWQLDISNTQVSERGCGVIFGLKQLQVLIAKSTPIGDDFLVNLGELRDLNLIDVSETNVIFRDSRIRLPICRSLFAKKLQVGDSEVCAIAGACPRLSYLDLSGCPVTSRVADHMHLLPNIAVLNLSDTAVDETFLERLPPGFLEKKIAITLPAGVPLSAAEDYGRGRQCVIRIDGWLDD